MTILRVRRERLSECVLGNYKFAQRDNAKKNGKGQEVKQLISESYRCCGNRVSIETERKKSY